MEKNVPFDVYDVIPKDMRSYLQFNGYNFNEKMAEFAISKMTDRTGAKYVPTPKDKVKEALAKYGITLEMDNGCNSWYVYNMAKSDYWGSSIADEQKLAMFVRDFIDDKDAGVGSEKPFRYFYAICMGKGMVIPWEEAL